MNKKRIMYIGILIIVTVIASITYFSYAFLSHIDEQHGKINIVAGTLDYRIESNALNNNGEITIGAGETKKFEIKVTSLNSIDSKYGLYYLTTSNDVEVGYSSSTVDNPVGQVTANNNKKIIVRVTNPTNSSQTVTFKAVGGFTGNTLTKEEGKAINQLTSLDTSCNVAVGTVYNFSYTGSAQTFNVPCDGAYKVELWGASGGTPTAETAGGLGAYTSGTIFLAKQKLYIYVGEAGKDFYNITDSSYNGGGSSNGVQEGGWHPEFYHAASGGGSTDIRLTNGNWDNFESLKSRIMVAAGGGGGYAYSSNTYSGAGGAAGGLTGYDGGPILSNPDNRGYYPGKGASQTVGGSTGGTFGSGANSVINCVGGGGGGYYGGGLGVHVIGSGGGSSFISGHNGCVAISETSTSDNITSKVSGCTDGTTNINCSVHYSNYAFANTVMVDGTGYKWTTVKESYVGQVQPDGTTAAGHSGNGYARITYLGQSMDYDYTGGEQVFISPIVGEYKLETWGAQGGSCNNNDIGGYGSYSSGIIDINTNKVLNVIVGGAGSCSTGNDIGGYNGGGNAPADSTYTTGSGGGATHVATEPGLLSTLSNNRDSILIVTGGGGGAGYARVGDHGSGGNAGGYIGNGGITNGHTGVYTTGGTQTSSGCNYDAVNPSYNECNGGFGYGANIKNYEERYHGGAGGGGYYGGGAPTFSYTPGGGGGSGYIGNSLLTNKKMVCYNCATSTDTNTYTISNTCVHTAATADCSKKGNGYARITYIGD